MSLNDAGLTFRAVIVTPAGERWIRETDSRAELLEWITDRRDRGRLVELAMTATEPAVRSMLTALAFGAAIMEREELARRPPASEEHR
jgi:hypothetical protein